MLMVFLTNPSPLKSYESVRDPTSDLSMSAVAPELLEVGFCTPWPFLLRFRARFFSPGGKGRCNSLYIRKLSRMRLGLQDMPSVQRLMPEACSS